MSFRSRSRTSGPSLDHRRSLSSSRVPISSTTSSYQSPYTSSSRPLSTSTYTSPYATNGSNHYSSRESLYNPPSSRSTFTYNPSVSSASSRRDSNPYASSYSSPYASAAADRYVSPYTSYENGVTTASLSLSSYNSPYKSADRGYSSGAYKKDYSSPRNGASSYLSSRFSTSNSNLSAYPSGPSSTASLVGRSQSFKDSDRRNRAARNEVARNEAARSESRRSTSRPLRRSERKEAEDKEIAATKKAEESVVKTVVPLVNHSSERGNSRDEDSPPTRPARKATRSYSVSSDKSEGYEVRSPGMHCVIFYFFFESITLLIIFQFINL